MKILSPNISVLSWRDDAAEYWFSPLNRMPWAMLLHSGHSNSHPYSRFDILVADPIGTLVTFGKVTEVTLKNKSFSSLEDPLSLLDKVMKNIFNFYIKSHQDIPFQGGALGLFGYDLVRRFEKLSKNALYDIKIPDMAIGLYDWALIIDHYKQQVLLLSHYDVNARLLWLKEQKTKVHQSFCLSSPWCSNMSAEKYAEKFNKVQYYLNRGDCYQVNLSQRFQAHYKGDEWKIFLYMNIKSRAPFSAFLRFKEGVILSFSPERFIKLFNGKIQTCPIKGTLPRLRTKEEDYNQVKKLKNSLKDRTENIMIVDLMRNDIGRVAIPGTVRVPELLKVESFPTVHHLVSTITAYLLPSCSPSDLLRASFPGGSVTGVPKIRAMEIIDELEPNCRNSWCGSIGYLSICGSMDTNIVIRTLTAFNNQLYCSAGGGIIADSQLQDEYQETFNKVDGILTQLKQYNCIL